MPEAMPQSTTPAAPVDAADDEWDTLATALNLRGVLHIAPRRRGRASLPRTGDALFERLLRSGEPRLQQAAILLLMTHPDLAAAAQTAVGRLGGVAHDRAMRRYVAAAALQRMAATRIAQHLGPQTAIPPAYVAELGLPPLDRDFGRAALLVLAAEERERYGYDAWATYRALLDLFLAEIRRAGWGDGCDNQPTSSA